MIVIIATLGLAVLAMSILSPVMPLYLTFIGVEPVIRGLIISVSMIGMAIGESSWGWFADRVGIKLPMFAGTFVCSLFVILFILTQNIPAIFAIFFFWSFVRSAVFGPAASLSWQVY
jgi:PPP family 3-phenylpropionic acid transporter